jgi:hypothetical protein
LTQGFWGGKRVAGRSAVTLLLLSALAVALTACGSREPAPSNDRPSVQAIVAALTESSGSDDAGAETGGEVRTSEGGKVSVQVIWENAGVAGGPLSFSVVMDTHSVDLDGYDLGRLAVLRNDRGQEVKPEQWDSAPGGHHRTGMLLFSGKDSAGNPVLGPEVKALELLIRDVAGVKERVLRWEVS